MNDRFYRSLPEDVQRNLDRSAAEAPRPKRRAPHQDWVIRSLNHESLLGRVAQKLQIRHGCYFRKMLLGMYPVTT